MAELLVRVKDESSADPYIDAKCGKRGDVITCVRDGWLWSKAEVSNPAWRIVKMPGISIASAVSAFANPEKDIDPKNPSRVLQSRAALLDLSALPASQLEDNSRRNPVIKLSVVEKSLLSLSIPKRPMQDPNVII